MTTPESPRPSRPRRLRNVVGLSLASLFNDAASEMVYPLLPLFLTVTLGAGPAVLGVIEGIAESVASLTKYLGGWLADRLPRRKSLVLAGYGLATGLRPLLALAAVPWHVLAVRVGDRLGKGVRTAPRDVLLAESVDPARRGAAFGVHRAADHIGAVIGPGLASLVLLAAPGNVRGVMVWSVVPGLLAVSAVGAIVRERPEVRAAKRSGEGRGRWADLGTGFRRFVLIMILFTLANASDVFVLLRAQDLGVAVPLVPILWSVFHVSKVACSVPGGLLADRFDPRRVVLAGWVVYAAVYLGFAAASQPWQAWLLMVAYGAFYGLTEGPERALVAGAAPAALRGRAFGAFHTAVGIAALPASLWFGAVWQRWGAGPAFAVGAGVAAIAAALLAAAPPPAEPGNRPLTPQSPVTTLQA